MRFKYLFHALCGISLTAAAGAQPIATDDDAFAVHGLERDRQSAVGVSLTVPFGPNANAENVKNAPRLGLSFTPDWRGQRAWAETPSNGFGVTLNGDMYVDFGNETLSFDQFAIRLGVDEQKAKSGNSAVPWIVGGALLVGGMVLVLEELEDTAEDTTRCVITAIGGGEDCSD